MVNGLHSPASARQTGRNISKGFFITLTVYCNDLTKDTPRSVGDALLVKFIKLMQWEVVVWKAERSKYGLLHYHITVPHKVKAVQVKQVWNTLLQEAGLLDEYYKKYGHYNPNTTDVKKYK